jgi:hypothetical protein
MAIDDRLLTDIKHMIEIAGQKGNTVVGPDDSNSGSRSGRGSRNSDDDDGNEDGNDDGNDDNDDDGSINNEELLSALISHTTRKQSDQPPTSFVQTLPQQKQKQGREKIKTTEARRRWLQEPFFYFSRNKNRNRNSNSRNNNVKHLKGLNKRYEAQSLHDSSSTLDLAEDGDWDDVGDLV